MTPHVTSARDARRRCIGFALVAAVAGAAPVAGQSLEQRVTAVGDGTVNFHFTSRPGVCGDGEHFIRSGRHSYYGEFSEEYLGRLCVEGPVQIRLTIRDGTVTRVQTYGGALRARDGQDLGRVPAPEAARYLLTIARTGRSSAGGKAIFGAVLADSATVWPALLDLVKQGDIRAKGARQEAMFWLSRYASGVVLGHPNDPFDNDESDDADEDLKRHAVFVLSQLPHGEGVAELLKVARSSNVSPGVRSQAFFWLGQSGDPRAVTLFESVLKS